MNTHPASEHCYREIEVSGVGDKNSVSSGPDSGANDLLAQLLWQCMRHGTTQVAVDNFGGLPTPLENEWRTLISKGVPSISAKGTGGCNIGGHGNEGLLETGMGQTGPFDTNKIILTWNEAAWGPQLDRLVATSVTMISIYSCHTGAGQDGANLLFAMARRSGRAVRGRTGYTYASTNDGIYFEDGSVWQVATPTNRPAPIEPPSPHLYPSAMIEFVGPSKEVFAASDATGVEITRVTLRSATAATARFAGNDAAAFVNVHFLSEAMQLPGPPIGMITARVSVTFATKGGKEVSLKFNVLNDRMFVDTSNTVGYYAAPGLKSFLGSL